jgi:hypothetical protein
MQRRLVTLLAAAALLAATAAPAVAHGNEHRNDGADHKHWQLAQVRKSTAEFHRINNVKKARYQLGYMEPFLLDGCIAHPTEGAMGYHYFNHDMIHDTKLDPRHPEGIVYAPMSNGKLRLAAVEWIVPQSLWEAEGHTGPPKLFGHELHILNPALGWYILHAWVWMYNPSGVFSDWNPRVICD